MPALLATCQWAGNGKGRHRRAMSLRAGRGCLDGLSAVAAQAIQFDPQRQAVLAVSGPFRGLLHEQRTCEATLIPAGRMGEQGAPDRQPLMPSVSPLHQRWPIQHHVD